jgi:ATP-dependent DNA helicase RecG
VGRGTHPSRCWLVTQPPSGKDASVGESTGNPRIEALVATTDGFELAEVDLDLRGEGTIMNTAQKGRSDLKIASLRRDRELVAQARDVAFEVVDADAHLDANPVLLDEVRLLFSSDEEAFLFKS